MTYLFDDQTLFDTALVKLQTPPEPSGPYVGQPGLRDPEHPCEVFEPGEPHGDCESDGHYVCTECAHLKPEKLIQPDYMSADDCKTWLANMGVEATTDDRDKLREAVWKVAEGEKP